MTKHPPAVINGALQHVSPSQIKTFRSCRRRWYQEKVLGVLLLQTPAMEKGEEIHEKMEDDFLQEFETAEETRARKNQEYTLSDIELQSCRLAKAMVPTARGPNGERWGYPERDMTGVSLAGVPVKGRIDYFYNDGKSLLVVDWKSIGDFSKVPSLHALTTSEQTILYSAYALLQLPVDAVPMKYIYIGKNEAKAVPRDLKLTKLFIDGMMKELDSIVAEIKITASKQSISDVECSCNRCRTKEATMGETKMQTPTAPLMLLIDAHPYDTSKVSYLEALIPQYAKAICEAEKVSDIRFVSYNRGPALLAAAFAKNPPSGTLVCRRGPLSSAIIEALIPIAAPYVIMGDV